MAIRNFEIWFPPVVGRGGKVEMVVRDFEMADRSLETRFGSHFAKVNCASEEDGNLGG